MHRRAGRTRCPLDGERGDRLQEHFTEVYTARGLDAGGCMGRVMTWLAVAGVLAALYVAYRYGVF